MAQRLPVPIPDLMALKPGLMTAVDLRAVRVQIRCNCCCPVVALQQAALSPDDVGPLSATASHMSPTP